MDWGNASDIISAGCNVAMAAAAGYAAFNAKQWFSQRSHTKGFDKAEELLSKIDIQYEYTVKLRKSLSDMWDYLENIEKEIILFNKEKNDFYSGLVVQCNNNIQNIEKIMHDLQIIERWSVRIKKPEYIYDVLFSFLELYSCFKMLCLTFDLNMEIYFKNSDSELTNSAFRKNYRETKNALIKNDKQYNSLTKHKFTQLFSIK
ncbi:hypothetical protein [Enterobacter hormaechei]|uniref:hypothetical protein n=1 Tax=Enterobacter hormaechei TaxID=158836 RepID=UPI0013312F06|nr:hypothetical protein [Enterobacter hormaechei]